MCATVSEIGLDCRVSPLYNGLTRRTMDAIDRMTMGELRKLYKQLTAKQSAPVKLLYVYHSMQLIQLANGELTLSRQPIRRAA